MGGTKWPSITSTWITRAPAAMHLVDLLAEAREVGGQDRRGDPARCEQVPGWLIPASASSGGNAGRPCPRNGSCRTIVWCSPQFGHWETELVALQAEHAAKAPRAGWSAGAKARRTRGSSAVGERVLLQRHPAAPSLVRAMKKPSVRSRSGRRLEQPTTSRLGNAARLGHDLAVLARRDRASRVDERAAGRSASSPLRQDRAPARRPVSRSSPGPCASGRPGERRAFPGRSRADPRAPDRSPGPRARPLASAHLDANVARRPPARQSSSICRRDRDRAPPRRPRPRRPYAPRSRSSSPPARRRGREPARRAGDRARPPRPGRLGSARTASPSRRARRAPRSPSGPVPDQRRRAVRSPAAGGASAHRLARPASSSGSQLGRVGPQRVHPKRGLRGFVDRAQQRSRADSGAELRPPHLGQPGRDRVGDRGGGGVVVGERRQERARARGQRGAGRRSPGPPAPAARRPPPRRIPPFASSTAESTAAWSAAASENSSSNSPSRSAATDGRVEAFGDRRARRAGRRARPRCRGAAPRRTPSAAPAPARAPPGRGARRPRETRGRPRHRARTSVAAPRTRRGAPEWRRRRSSRAVRRAEVPGGRGDSRRPPSPACPPDAPR